MRAPISVVIPTLNAERPLVTALGALFEGVEAGLIRELIVVDGGSHDGTVTLASEAGANVLHSPPSRGGQLRVGCAAAKGEWLLVLHADSVLQEGWSAAVQDHMVGGRAGFFRLQFAATGVMPHVVAGWANLRARLLGLPFGDQGLLLPRTLYEDVGGFPDVPLMEDVALVRALKGKLVAIDAAITTSADRYQNDGWLHRGARNIGLQLRYMAGASPDDLAQRYRPKQRD